MDNYDERIRQLDEQFCSLLKERKALTENRMVELPEEVMIEWAEAYGLHVDYVKSLFNIIQMEDQFRPRVEPLNFRKYVPVMQSVETEDYLYSVTFIRQYENASVVQLHVNWDGTDDRRGEGPNYPYFSLAIGEGYDCREEGGSGTTGHATQEFVVSPALPDDLSGTEFKFSTVGSPFFNQSHVVEFNIRTK
ncbi:hypothetical protein AB1K83_12200 [Sporosarcina sp. 179-K 3D1 HS]|uniref:hypothetical protein n=1 Tax=Sporosarcina sp. 179-K 3D1 HS TaxID=3232169 RepID=UPI0039A14A18